MVAGQRCDKGVNKRIFWRVLNITAKLSQECFAEKYRGIWSFFATITSRNTYDYIGANRWIQTCMVLYGTVLCLKHHYMGVCMDVARWAVQQPSMKLQDKFVTELSEEWHFYVATYVYTCICVQTVDCRPACGELLMVLMERKEHGVREADMYQGRNWLGSSCMLPYQTADQRRVCG